MAFLLSPLTWMALAIAVLSGLLFMEHNNRIAAEKGEKAAQELASLKTQDAERWQAASGVRDQALTVCRADQQKQSDAVEAARTDIANLNIINARYAAELRAARDTAQGQEQETRNDARQRPAEVHNLGAVACAQYRRLYGAAAACTNTGTAPGN